MKYIIDVEKKDGMKNECKLVYTDITDAVIDLIKELIKADFKVTISGGEEE